MMSKSFLKLIKHKNTQAGFKKIENHNLDILKMQKTKVSEKIL